MSVKLYESASAKTIHEWTEFWLDSMKDYSARHQMHDVGYVKHLVKQMRGLSEDVIEMEERDAPRIPNNLPNNTSSELVEVSQKLIKVQQEQIESLKVQIQFFEEMKVQYEKMIEIYDAKVMMEKIFGE